MPEVWTSRSAMPAALIAATSRFIASLLARIAPFASAAWVTTPVDRVAMSGVRLASALAEIDSSVPSVGAACVGADWADAVVIDRLPRARLQASIRGRNEGVRIGGSMDERQGRHEGVNGS